MVGLTKPMYNREIGNIEGSFASKDIFDKPKAPLIRTYPPTDAFLPPTPIAVARVIVIRLKKIFRSMLLLSDVGKERIMMRKIVSRIIFRGVLEG